MPSRVPEQTERMIECSGNVRNVRNTCPVSGINEASLNSSPSLRGRKSTSTLFRSLLGTISCHLYPRSATKMMEFSSARSILSVVRPSRSRAIEPAAAFKTNPDFQIDCKSSAFRAIHSTIALQSIGSGSRERLSVSIPQSCRGSRCLRCHSSRMGDFRNRIARC